MGLKKSEKSISSEALIMGHIMFGKADLEDDEYEAAGTTQEVAEEKHGSIFMSQFKIKNWDADLYNYGTYGPGSETNWDYWRSKNGIRTALRDLELRHLKNCIALVMRKDIYYSTRLIFKRLLLEQKRREDEGDLW